MYTKESLVELNRTFCDFHPNVEIGESEVARANKLCTLIEATRSDAHPMPGDIVEFTTEYGDWYPNAHVHLVDGDKTLICEVSSVPDVIEHEGQPDIGHVSGGPWEEIPSTLRKIGQRQKTFGYRVPTDFMNTDVIEFRANVNVWAYAEPNPLFGEYTTRQYDRFHIYFLNDPDIFGYRVLVIGGGGTNYTAFRNQREYIAWLATYKGVEFKVANGAVVFVYRKQEALITKKEWDALSLPIDTRRENDLIDIKFDVNDEEKTVTEYRYCNGGDSRACYYDEPYGRAASEIICGCNASYVFAKLK